MLRFLKELLEEVSASLGVDEKPKPKRAPKNDDRAVTLGYILQDEARAADLRESITANGRSYSISLMMRRYGKRLDYQTASKIVEALSEQIVAEILGDARPQPPHEVSRNAVLRVHEVVGELEVRIMDKGRNYAADYLRYVYQDAITETTISKVIAKVIDDLCAYVTVPPPPAAIAEDDIVVPQHMQTGAFPYRKLLATSAHREPKGSAQAIWLMEEGIARNGLVDLGKRVDLRNALGNGDLSTAVKAIKYVLGCEDGTARGYIKQYIERAAADPTADDRHDDTPSPLGY